MSRLEKTTHVLLILVCCISLFLLLERRFGTRQAQVQPAAKVGRKLIIAGARWNQSGLTVLLGMSSTCRYCKESVPLYRTISTIRARTKARLSFVVVSPEPTEVIQKRLREERIYVDQILRSGFGALGIRGTPTIFVVDSGGIIQHIFEGRLTQTRQASLLAVLPKS